MGEMSKLKPCPFCGSEAEESFAGGGNVACSNNDCQAGMLMLYPNVWNARPIEDKLLARAEKAEAMVERMIANVNELGGVIVWGGWQDLVDEWNQGKGNEAE